MQTIDQALQDSQISQEEHRLFVYELRKEENQVKCQPSLKEFLLMKKKGQLI